MSTEIDNIIIEHLKALRNELKEFRSETREDLQTIKMRLNSLEHSPPSNSAY